MPSASTPCSRAQALICLGGTGAALRPHHMTTSSSVVAQLETTLAESAGKERNCRSIAANSSPAIPSHDGLADEQNGRCQQADDGAGWVIAQAVLTVTRRRAARVR